MARVLFWLACLKIIQLSLTYLRIDVRTQIEGIGEIEKILTLIITAVAPANPVALEKIVNAL